MRRSISAAAVATVAVALLTACSGTTTPSAPTSSTESPTTTASTSTTGTAPNAEQTAWAGQVCTAAAVVKKDAEGLSSASTSGGDVSAKLTAQLGVIKGSANTLAATVKTVPAGSESDPGFAAVKASADQLTASINSVEASVSALEGKSGLSKVSALASVGSAAGAAVSKVGATAQAIETASKDGKSALGQAFATAPACVSLNAS
jgi:hypothetical protein